MIWLSLSGVRLGRSVRAGLSSIQIPIMHRLLTFVHFRTERKWREWTDRHFIHLISPNVYRTIGESLETFRWFSDAGQWEQNFPAWERHLMVYGGATAMYFIGRRLKKRHNLGDDVRRPIYKACNSWMAELRKQKTDFLGGNAPNLADLAFYGALNSMEGCQAFEDICDNTKIGEWHTWCFKRHAVSLLDSL